MLMLIKRKNRNHKSLVRRVKKMERRVMKVEDFAEITTHEIKIIIRYCKKTQNKCFQQKSYCNVTVIKAMKC